MPLSRFKTTTIFEVDIESGKSRILQHYTTQIGEGVKLAKPKKKEVKIEELTTQKTEFMEL